MRIFCPATLSVLFSAYVVPRKLSLPKHPICTSRTHVETLSRDRNRALPSPRRCSSVMVLPVHAVGRVAPPLILRPGHTSPRVSELRPGRIRAVLDADTRWV